jgi:hypothetical protein
LYFILYINKLKFFIGLSANEMRMIKESGDENLIKE